MGGGVGLGLVPQQHGHGLVLGGCWERGRVGQGGVCFASSGLGFVQLGLLLRGKGFLLQLGYVRLGLLHCSSVQLGIQGSLAQLGNVVQVWFLHCTSVQLCSLGTLSQPGTVHHCTSVQLGSYLGLFLGNLGLIWGFY